MCFYGSTLKIVQREVVLQVYSAFICLKTRVCEPWQLAIDSIYISSF